MARTTSSTPNTPAAAVDPAAAAIAADAAERAERAATAAAADAQAKNNDPRRQTVTVEVTRAGGHTHRRVLFPLGSTIQMELHDAEDVVRLQAGRLLDAKTLKTV